MAREFDSVAEVEDILARGAFEELNNSLENEFFEAKSEPWDLDSERGKFDLARDVSSMANWRGGVIVVAAWTPSLTHQRREIKEVRRLPVSLAPSDRYSNVIADWIYPAPVGVSFRWHQDRYNHAVGVMSVRVPDYDEELRPFLVAHYLPEEASRIRSVVGLFQRLGSTTKPTPVEDLHAFIREGRRLDEIHQKLDTIIARMESPSGASETWIGKILSRFRHPSD